MMLEKLWGNAPFNLKQLYIAIALLESSMTWAWNKYTLCTLPIVILFSMIAQFQLDS